ncbi:MAG: FHA domain-containing protein [Acidobacteriota bacterium]
MSQGEWKVNPPQGDLGSAQTIAESPLAKTVREIAPGVPQPAAQRKTMRLSEKRPPAVGWLVDIDGAQKGEDFRLIEGKVTLGASPSCDIQLDNEFASDVHASLRYDQGNYSLTDLDSTNGTAVNGEPITRVELEDGDHIRIGDTNYVFKGLFLGAAAGGAR